MSDVWSELEERLKQKAKTLSQLTNKYFEKLSEANTLKEWKNLDCFLESQWVRLEDVKETIQQLKQNYVLVRKNAPDRGHLLNSIRSDRIEKAREAVCFDCPYYDDCEAGTPCFKRFLEVLLRDE